MATRFYISDLDRVAIERDATNHFTKAFAAYKKAPQNYGDRKLSDLIPTWKENAVKFATFQQLDRDGIATITKTPDAFYSFEDHKGDCFDPEVNNDIDPAELKRQERNERARYNRQGVYFHELMIGGESFGSIGGFVGGDFYGSGYDYDFYQTAIEQSEKVQPHHAAQVANVARETKAIKKQY